LLAAAREETGLAIVTEVMSEDDVPLVAEYADILQIGSRSMENYTLLSAAARSGRPILLKRGMMATIADVLRSAQVILSNGNPNVILCERGIRTFETAMRNGHRELVPALARIGIAAGADGLLVEVHPDPNKAWSDGEQSLDFEGFAAMMAALEPWIALRKTSLQEEKLDQRENAGIRLAEAVA
jgi:3-deoxy-7-phosphoheptulonate synthase